jgi:hypothetical protein
MQGFFFVDGSCLRKYEALDFSLFQAIGVISCLASVVIFRVQALEVAQ